MLSKRNDRRRRYLHTRYSPQFRMCNSDVDPGGCMETGRSTSGILCMYAAGPVSWSSKRQNTVAISSIEAEIVATNEGAREISWLKSIYKDITSEECQASLSAIRLAKNPPEFHQRKQHISDSIFFHTRMHSRREH